MNAMTHHRIVALSPAPEEPRLAENVYRIVCALRADPQFAEAALPPEAYLAALDNPPVAATTPADAEKDPTS